MKRALLVLAAAALLLGASIPAAAQNRLAIEGGALFPMGSMGDYDEVSPYIGASFEFQRLNALGQMALGSFFLRAGYAPMQVKQEVKDSIKATGGDDSSSFFEALLGFKAYSSASPIYLGVDAGYVNFSPPGSGAKSGVGTGILLGMSFGGPAVRFAIEGRAHYAFMSGIDNFSYLGAVATLGFPF